MPRRRTVSPKLLRFPLVPFMCNAPLRS